MPDQNKEVAEYRKVFAATQPLAAVAPGQPLSLERALALANQYNESLNLQGEQYLQSLIARQRIAAAFQPTLSLAPTYYVQERGGGGTSGGGGGSSSWKVPVNGQANVFRGFSDVNSYRAASKNIEQQRALLLDAQANLLLNVAQVYYNVLQAQQSVVVLENSVKVQEAHVRDARIRKEVGTGNELALRQSEAQAASTRATLIAARNDVVTGRATLAFLVNAPVQDSPLADELPLPAVLPPLTELEQTALASRQDLLASVAASQAARYQVTAAFGQYFPSVSLNVNYILDNYGVAGDSNWNALFSANLPIFSAGVIEANVRQAWSVFRQSKLTEAQLRRQIAEQIQIANQNLLTSRQRLLELGAQVQAAAEAVRLAAASFNAGTATNLDVLTAQDQLLSAQLQEAFARYSQKVLYLNLLRSMGRLSLRLPGEPATAPATLPATIPATQPAQG
jgi:outer membrane protein TolC